MKTFCFQLLVDDLLVYNGTLEPVTRRGILPHVDGPMTHHTVIFTDDRDIRQKEKHATVKYVVVILKFLWRMKEIYLPSICPKMICES